MDNIDMTSILKTISSFEEKRNQNSGNKKQDIEINNKNENKDIEKDNEVEKISKEVENTNQGSDKKSQESEKLIKEPEKKLTLTESIEKIINESTLSNKISLVANEVVSFTNCVKQLTIEGRIPKENESDANSLKVKLHERLIELIGQNVNFEEFWKVQCGTVIGDKFKTIECFDINNEKVEITATEGKSLIIDIWKTDSNTANYLDIKALTMSEIIAGNVEGIDLNKLEFLAISADNFFQWQSLIKSTNIDKHLKQYLQSDIIEKLSIDSNTMLPALLVVDNEGIIKYLDNYANIDFEESLKNLSNGSNIIKLRDEGENTDANSWWLEMDSHTKIDIVRDINMSMRQLGINNAGFGVITKYNHKEGKVTSSTLPTFMGTVFETEYEILQSYAIELQNTWNLTNFQFNCKIMSFQ